MSYWGKVRYLEISKIYDKIIKKYKETKMTKEMTVAEIAEALGYEVKVVKEQPKPEPFQFMAGDVAKFSCNGDFGEKRIMIEIHGELHSVDVNGYSACFAGKDDQEGRRFKTNGYVKVGELKDYIK